jgi:hypothetical protein
MNARRTPSRNIGITRRAVLRVGSLSPLGFGLLDVLAPQASAAPKTHAKSVILLFMWGGPSHLDTWDLKPEAPKEIRGLFQSIPTNVPGIRIGEHFPRLATQAKRYAIVRSMTHTDVAHLSPVHHLMTGRTAAKVNSETTVPAAPMLPALGLLSKSSFPPQVQFHRP